MKTAGAANAARAHLGHEPLGHVQQRAARCGRPVIAQQHADGGVVTHAYNTFGEKVATTSAETNRPGSGVERVTRFAYDKLAVVPLPMQFVDLYQVHEQKAKDGLLTVPPRQNSCRLHRTTVSVQPRHLHP